MIKSFEHNPIPIDENYQRQKLTDKNNWAKRPHLVIMAFVAVIPNESQTG